MSPTEPEQNPEEPEKCPRCGRPGFRQESGWQYSCSWCGTWYSDERDGPTTPESSA
jgi:ribosomal protein L37E